MSECYGRYVRLLNLIVHRYATSPTEFETMMGIANEAYCRAVQDWPKRTKQNIKFTSFMGRYVHNALIDRIRSNGTARKYTESLRPGQVEDHDKETAQEFDNPLQDDSLNPERLMEFRSALGTLSAEAQEVVQMIFDSPEEILEGAKSLAPRYLRGELTRVLRRRRWKWNRIESAMKEIKTVVSSIYG